MKIANLGGFALLGMGALAFALGVSAALASTDGCNMQVMHNPSPPPGSPQWMNHPTMQCSQATCDDGAPCETAAGMDGGGNYQECHCDESGSQVGPVCITRKYISGGNVTNVTCTNNGCVPSPPMQCKVQPITTPAVPDPMGYYVVRCKCIYDIE